MIKIGFTGTQVGMTRKQKSEFLSLVDALIQGQEFELHHGDCIGADTDAHNLCVENWPCYIILHPPQLNQKRSFCEFTESRKPLAYLERNKSIVEESDLLIATPREYSEQLRSGTWATVRYARKMKKEIHIIYPE